MYAYLFKAKYYKKGTWNSLVHRLSWTKQKYQNSVLLKLGSFDLGPERFVSAYTPVSVPRQQTKTSILRA